MLADGISNMGGFVIEEGGIIEEGGMILTQARTCAGHIPSIFPA
jgi:hypothetical protein